jgi:hypothetical protein
MIASTLRWMVLQDLNNSEINFSLSHFENKEEVMEKLVEPFKAEFTDARGEKLSLWIVLDEFPQDDTSGYLIVFEEDEQLFGLATKTSYISKWGLLVGIYGSFADTLVNM